MKKNIMRVMILALMLSPVGLALRVQATTIPNWDATGSYVVAMDYLGTDYAHDMNLVQDGLGNLTGDGGYPAGGAHVYTWMITSGTVVGNMIDLYADYTAPADAVTPLTVLHIAGIIAADGTISGTWSDNYQGGARSGSMTTTSGNAIALGSMTAEDFGVVDYDTGLGQLRGYTAGFGLTDATFEDAQSVVVKLYAAGDVLLQTNTATPLLGATITGSQISSPFDVSGSFDYLTDGYWTNVRESEFGQTVPATKVVATVTLANGKIVTATNTLLVGDPTTIYPIAPPVVDAPTDKNQCKNGGWKTFTDPTFRNQGQCVSYTNHLN